MAEIIETHLMANANLSRKEILINNFLGGLAWGFGTVVGATVVVAILFSILKTFNFIPGVGQVIDQVGQTSVQKALQR